MNKFSLEKLFDSLRNIRLTSSEKSFMRLRVAQYMHRHSTGSSSWMFPVRYMIPAALALVLFLGTGGVVAFASRDTLPGQTLYPIKRATEQVKKIAIHGSKAQADYELALIDKRFSETNQLVTQQKLTVETEATLTGAIQQHTNDFKNDIIKLAENDPAEALSYNTKLGNTLKTGTHILLALSDKQSPTDARTTPNTLVLAAYATAEKISVEKKQLEAIVLSDTSVATIKTAEKRYTETLAMLKDREIAPIVETTTIPDATITTKTDAAATTLVAKTMSTTEAKITASDTTTVDSPVVLEKKPADLQTLANSLQTAYESKKYREVITIADQIDQVIHEAKKIKEAEETFKVDLSSQTSTTTPVINTDTTVEAVTNGATSSVTGSLTLN